MFLILFSPFVDQTSLKLVKTCGRGCCVHAALFSDCRCFIPVGKYLRSKSKVIRNGAKF